MKHQSDFFKLMSEAAEMLSDRLKPEQDLIYYIARMEDELRSAIVLAYQGLYDDKPKP